MCEQKVQIDVNSYNQGTVVQITTRYISSTPSITARRSQNLKDLLVQSEYGEEPACKKFGSKGPKWGCIPCGRCIACPNIVRTDNFTDSSGKTTFKITQHITCSTRAVVYYATCPCQKIYVGLTTRELKVRVREHMRDIRLARVTDSGHDFKPVARHFLKYHDADPALLKVCGIDRIQLVYRIQMWQKDWLSVNLGGFIDSKPWYPTV
ncbi:uncharacterized protein LOC130367312 [Hyla sarda]|uniref:uncharacterized protein LOC130367312 n=1 Tax=Hyla sarda TaxID=327740 RepID=UPI0024C3E0C5|nr:uncharacterized protein LOC130367312 [Hyla sarda]